MRNSTDDPFADFDLLCDFPWTGGAFNDLKRYLRVVNEFLPHTTAQRTVRLNAQLKSERDPVTIGELESAVESVLRDGSTVFPHLVWGSLLVATYGVLEFGIIQTFDYWRKVVGHPVKFEKPSSKGFLSCAQAYAESQVQEPLFHSPSERSKLDHLSSLRNSFVHRESQMVTLPKALASAIATKAYIGASMEVVDGQWVANARSTAFYLLVSERIVHSFGNVVVEKCLHHVHSRARKA